MNKIKHNKLLLGLGLVTVIALPLAMVSCSNKSSYGNKILTPEVANEFFGAGGKWEDKTTFVAEDFREFSQISKESFGNRELTSVEFHDGITDIGELAFQSNLLSSITIPDSVTTIGDRAFTNNKFTLESSIKLPKKFNTPEERKRVGLPFNIDLQLTPKSINEIEKIEASDISHLSEAYKDVDNSSIPLIKKLFNTENTSQDNWKDGLEIKLATYETNQRISLRTKVGYALNFDNPEEKEIQSAGFKIDNGTTITNVVLTPKNIDEIEPVLESDITHLSTTEYIDVKLESISLIKKLFDTSAINADDLNDQLFGLQIKMVEEGLQKKVFLSPSKSSTINGSTSDIFSSYFKVEPTTPTITDLKITANYLTGVTFTEAELEKAGLTNTFADVTQPMLGLVNKLFNTNGAAPANLTNGLLIMATMDADKKITVTLKAKPNFTISGEVNAQVSSKTFTPIAPTNLNLVVNPTPAPINETELANLTDKFSKVDGQSIPLIKKLFTTDVVNSVLISGLNIKAVTTETGTIISLQSIKGFHINSTTPELLIIDSTSFTAEQAPTDLKLVLNPKPEPINETELAHLTDKFSKVDEKSIILIKKLFTTDVANDILISGLNIKAVTTETGTIISLQSIKGFHINSQYPSLIIIDSTSFVAEVTPD